MEAKRKVQVSIQCRCILRLPDEPPTYLAAGRGAVPVGRCPNRVPGNDNPFCKDCESRHPEVANGTIVTVYTGTD